MLLDLQSHGSASDQCILYVLYIAPFSPAVSAIIEGNNRRIKRRRILIDCCNTFFKFEAPRLRSSIILFLDKPSRARRRFSECSVTSSLITFGFGKGRSLCCRCFRKNVETLLVVMEAIDATSGRRRRSFRRSVACPVRSLRFSNKF